MCDRLSGEVCQLRKEIYEVKQEVKIYQKKATQSEWYCKKKGNMKRKENKCGSSSTAKIVPAVAKKGSSRCLTLTALFNKPNVEASVGSSTTDEVIITSDDGSSSQKKSDESETRQTAPVGSFSAEQKAISPEENDPCSQKESEDGETTDGSQATCQVEESTNVWRKNDEADSEDFLVQAGLLE